MVDDDGITPEADLIRRAQAGDEEAVRTLFEQHVADLRRRVHRKLPALARGKLAESDVIQEAYLTAFLRLGDFEDRGEGSFGRWLGKILENKLHHEARRYLGTTKRAAWREVNLPLSGAEPGMACRHRTPGSEVAAAEEVERLAQAMRTLPLPDQEILRLVHESGLPFTEAAGRLGITSDAARMRYGRALTRVSQCMQSQRPERGHAAGRESS